MCTADHDSHVFINPNSCHTNEILRRPLHVVHHHCHIISDAARFILQMLFIHVKPPHGTELWYTQAKFLSRINRLACSSVRPAQFWAVTAKTHWRCTQPVRHENQFDVKCDTKCLVFFTLWLHQTEQGHFLWHEYSEHSSKKASEEPSARISETA